MSQVVPLGKINQAYAVLATTNGRDKVSPFLALPAQHPLTSQVYRLVQYLSRLISWYLVRKGSIDTADRFIGLKNGLMQARRG
jgi:peroxin-11B